MAEETSETMVFSNSFAVNAMLLALKSAKDESALVSAIQRLKGFLTANGSPLGKLEGAALTAAVNEQKKGAAWTDNTQAAIKELDAAMEANAAARDGRTLAATTASLSLGDSAEDIANSEISLHEPIKPGRKVFMRIDREQGPAMIIFKTPAGSGSLLRCLF
jgi:hypothetical protein